MSAQDRYRLTADEMRPEYNDDSLWGQFLYKKHTDCGKKPISYKIASTLSIRDLECILFFSAVAPAGYISSTVMIDTIQICLNVLIERDTPTKT